MHVLICENSMDGIFTGIYQAYAKKYGHTNTQLITEDLLDTYNLFCEYEKVPVDTELSGKVAKKLREHLGPDTYFDLCQAVNAYENPKDLGKNINKAEAIYKTVVFGLSMKNGSSVLTYLANPYVCRTFELCRNCYNEADHFRGFLRFQELENGILFARIHPMNHILPFLANHFTDRLPMENFIIYDETRKTAAIHKSGSGYMLAEVPNANEEFMNHFSSKELEYQQLWLGFFNSIAIEARKNPKLQAQNIPKRFWKDTVELKDP